MSATADEHLVHGTYDGYHNHGCRCAACRQANTDYQRIRSWQTGRHRPMAEAVALRPRAAHGTESRYNGGCRCDECRAGAAAARRRRRAGIVVAREQALEWLLHWPEYREVIRQRISEEQKRRRLAEIRLEARDRRGDVDTLGREVEGCG